jgi:ATP-dependent exoDNAse (exonuclease V) alpha subunit
MATTIHSRIYKPYFDTGAIYFDLTDDPNCEGFIVDEASMVSEEIFQDLQSFELPMIFVGDHGQLEPVDSKFNLMEKPNYCLEEIHRNAGEIAQFAEHLRNGYAARSYKKIGEKVSFVNDLTDKMLSEVDQVICAFNKTRVGINSRVREYLGYSGLLNIGEKVMCLRNNRRQGLFNGMQGIVTKLYTGQYGRKYMDFEFDGNLLEGIWYDYRQFGQDSYKIKHGQDTPNPFDYAYCITAHKAQGDEWNRVLVMEQRCANWSHKRWAYTAASRARENLLWKIS